MTIAIKTETAISDLGRDVERDPRAAVPLGSYETFFPNYPNLKLYALLDAAIDQNLLELLEALEQPNLCLFQGDIEDKVGAAAPYLVTLEPNDNLLARLLSGENDAIGLTSRGQGMLILSSATPAQLVFDLKRHVMLRGDDERLSYFRFWDPVIMHGLRLYFRENPQAADGFFGASIDTILYPAPNKRHWVSMRQDGEPTAPRALKRDAELVRAAGTYGHRARIFALEDTARAALEGKDDAALMYLDALPGSGAFGLFKRLSRMGAMDAHQSAQIVSINAATQMDVTSDPAFHYVTRNAFFSSNAKVRHLVDSYKLIGKLASRQGR